MILRDLISCLSRVTASGSLDVEVLKIVCSSRECEHGSLFAAFRGTSIDGHKFIQDAIAAGASVILAETAPPADLAHDLTWLHVSNSREALAALAAQFSAHPSHHMKMIGVTGTNGKTTTSYLVHHVLKTQWHRAGLLGTILVDDGETRSDAKHTTPGSVELADILVRMQGNGCRGVAMEVSSHGIDQHRVASLAFDACVFTNLTQDHLDYHGTLANYFRSKADWFQQQAQSKSKKKPIAVINADDAHGIKLIDELTGKMPIVTFGFGVHCDFRANGLRQSAKGMEFELTHKGKSYLVRVSLIGRFNVYNLLAAISSTTVCGVDIRDAVKSLQDAPQVPGRMEYVGNAGGSHVFVDYAHTPDALENACRTLKELQPRRLITVFGCGGDRDKSKRPQMARAASEISDICILTSDNPRSEDPQQILNEVESGMVGSSYRIEPDRAVAIEMAVQGALSGDIILIAGKGHETYQQFATETIAFDDRKVASKALKIKAQDISDQR